MNMYIYLFLPKKPNPQTLNLINLYQRICMSEMFYHVNGEMITSCVSQCDLIIGGIVQYCSIVATCNLLLSFPFLACFELLFDAKFDNINLKK